MSKTAAACLSLLPLLSIAPAALSESASTPVIVTLSVSRAPAPSGDSIVECRDVPEWTAARREWMTRNPAWCSVGIDFRYEGSGGDIKMVVSKEASARAAPTHYASTDLPANGGETSPFHFIFPCPTTGAERLCLSYEPDADAGELSYDFIELGVDAAPVPVAPFEPYVRQDPEEEAAAPRERTSIVPRRPYVSYAADGYEPVAVAQLTYARDVELTSPAPAPISGLRKRAR
jgi:hypothetical protein